jgi:hypothetical protein
LSPEFRSAITIATIVDVAGAMLYARRGRSVGPWQGLLP